MVDVPSQINAVHRAVAERERDGAPTKVVILSQTYDTDRADLWDACTNPERIPRWFLPVTGDLRLGGRYQLEGNAEGEVTHCEEPELLAMTWEFGGDVTWVQARLTEVAPERTRLDLEHAAHVPPELWSEFGPGAVGAGWDTTLLGLALHISGGSLGDGVDPEAWMGSEEGLRFVTESSQRWGAASAAFGTPAEQAEAAAARTTAAYTEVPRES